MIFTQKNILLTSILVTIILAYTSHTHCMNYHKMVEEVNKRYQKLCEAAKQDDLTTVENLFEKNKDVLTNPYIKKDGYKKSPTHIAATKNSLKVLAYFIQQKNTLNINLEENLTYEGTPLHFAAKKGKLEAVKLLVEKGGVNKKIYNRYAGGFPLDLAKEHEDIKKYLEN